MDTFLRLRPPLASHTGEVPFLRVSSDKPETTVTLQTPLSHSRSRASNDAQVLQFSRVLQDTCTQADVFLTAILPKVLAFVQDGTDGLVFAMGVTGSGKSYTMFGDDGIAGIVQMTIWALLKLTRSLSDDIPAGGEALVDRLEAIQKNTLVHGAITMTLAELYNEKFWDLLHPGTAPLSLKRSRHAGVEACQIAGLDHLPIRSTSETCHTVQQACLNRREYATQANNTSSRSHAILTFHLNGHALTLVDLAGSERQKQAGTHGARLGEAGRINLSLMAVGQCLEALKVPGEGRFPARQSKLTELLFDGRFWSSSSTAIKKVAMLMCIDPTRFYDENVQMLKYATDANQVRANSRLGRPKLSNHAIQGKELELVERLCRSTSQQESTRSRGQSSFEIRQDSDGEEVDQTLDYWRDLATHLLAERVTVENQIREELMDEAERMMAAMERRHRQELAELRDMYEKQMDAKVDLLEASTASLTLQPVQINTLDMKGEHRIKR
ncbi:P-loop containing nucleoside triphosphate hydrolase protein [Protomyces lactucae-debilis]|uniref:p-loop containing nucleoside triphosphate hydrolase protein n=1 Tax=Protomyces lactucae-debilis TaxID=2754530 RepID=A0A1Y2FJZ3_PROLT|nr:P-loop containing nucleoside triphosphate hydrolase protein [Protomyces lactucae-debilis]ORY83694.1 P-loop containing nucleoside triphosphate hydrolase protein [Protomyces lactucae-debilis]